MAERFASGGSLIVAGEGAQASDAQHVALQFVHRSSSANGRCRDRRRAISASSRRRRATCRTRLLPRRCGRSGARRISCSGFVPGTSSPRTERAVGSGAMRLTVLAAGRAQTRAARRRGMRIGESNPLLVQEVAETLYHAPWDSVHVSSKPMTHGHDSLPPPRGVKARISSRKCRLPRCKRYATCARSAERLTRPAEQDPPGRPRDGGVVRLEGKLLAFVTGGAHRCARRRGKLLGAFDCRLGAVTALASTNDVGVVTAIGNDVGFEHVFSRRYRPWTTSNIGLAFSPSGASRNVHQPRRGRRRRVVCSRRR